MAKIDLEKVLIALLDSPFNKQFDDKVKDALEEQGLEYKDGEIVEVQKVKFREGDWVVQENIGVFKIIEICESWYEVIDSEDNHYSISFDKEYMCHLWDITKDAKDGDVLYSPCCKLLWIYKEEKTCYVGSNLNYNSGSIVINKPVCIPTDVQPTTEEQRDLLFQKIKEAGYEWDADKLELRKIEPINPCARIYFADFNGGEGFYKLSLDNLNKKQVEAIEALVASWNKKSITIMERKD